MRNKLLLCVALGFGLAASCEKKEARSPGENSDGSTLCTKYATCDECIAGEQKEDGISQGEAETECGAAVLGCWTTWDKPITCHGKAHHEKPAS